MITLDQVLDTLQELADYTAGQYIVRDHIDENWSAKDTFWDASIAVRCLNFLDATWPRERVKWFNIAAVDPDDILAMANADFDMRKCDVCEELYHIAGVDSDFQAKYGVTPRGGDTYDSASGKDIYICDHCSVTNKVVGLFVQ